MPSETVNVLNIKITSDASEATKELKKAKQAVSEIAKETQKGSKNKALEETKKELVEIGSQFDLMKQKAGYLKTLGQGGSLDKAAKAERARVNYALQYLSVSEKINRMQDSDGKSAVADKYLKLSKTELLQKSANRTRMSLEDAIANGDEEKANKLALQYLGIQEKIDKIKEDAEKKAEKERREIEKAAEAAKKKAEAEEKAKQKADEYARAQAEAERATRKAAITSFFKSVGSTVAQRITEPFKRAHKAISKLFSSIGRIAFYRLIRSAIREVTQGFSEGVKNLYAWSEAFNTKFAPTMDMFKTQMTYLKNGFAAMFSPLIEWVVPNVIVPLTDAMVELFNLIQQGFAVLVGHDYWYKAQKSMQKFGEATGKANIQLAKFDELNNLTETGSGANDDASGMFTLEKVQNTFSNGLFKTIRDSIKKGDWFSVGKVIADGINKGIKNFDAIGIAESIAETINNAFDMLAGLGATMNWEQIGRKLGDFIDTLFKKVNWTQMGKAVGSVAGGIAKVFLQAIANIDIESVFNAIFSLLSGLIQGIGDALFEDDGYLAKKIGLQFAKTLVLAVKYGVQAWNNLQDANIFNGGDYMFMKAIGIDKGSFEKYKKATTDITFNAILKPINDAMDTLDKNHEQFLAEQKTTTVNSLNHMLDGVNLTGQGQTIGNQIMNGINSAINGSQIAASFGSHTVEVAFGAARGGFIPMANGGTLSQGTLFAAGEVPGQAEMVGNINGRTGVASGFEITGIRDAVLSTGEAEVQLLNRLIQALERKNLVISPSAQLGRVVAQSNRLYGAVTG